MDFGRTAADYGRFRVGFPEGFFARLAEWGIGLAGQRIVDLGTGTGVLAREFAAAGCVVTGVDVARELLDDAATHGPEVTYRLASADDTGLPGDAWDAVTAAQCWHWFDRPKVIAEVRRLLVDGGSLVICGRDYPLEPGSLGALSEELVLRHNPDWGAVGNLADEPMWTEELRANGFGAVRTFEFTVDVPFTHEAWRGRMRSSNGVGASMSPDQVAAFDAELARLLAERFPEPLFVPHRVWAIGSTKEPGAGQADAGA
ncbi:MAG TPA: class I SAM-dependent methyltransferase [Pseudonocardiaceae bacterium]|nr:class I SAM-dependent methyltransferase [Pseudonocardiaceae bacterium]